jgi:hypothetical protein
MSCCTPIACAFCVKHAYVQSNENGQHVTNSGADFVKDARYAYSDIPAGYWAAQMLCRVTNMKGPSPVLPKMGSRVTIWDSPRRPHYARSYTKVDIFWALFEVI